ncbi:hypothetical protein ACPVTF_01105 [Geobacillus icigianus]|uniref:hypothetical protein n=1 Tax=Geobacillus TaxID=129337 RepID=UPI0015537C1D|nr:hypothetical protein [Geobacillus subterraneus]
MSVKRIRRLHRLEAEAAVNLDGHADDSMDTPESNSLAMTVSLNDAHLLVDHRDHANGCLVRK